jgi:hypothetical protein
MKCNPVRNENCKNDTEIEEFLKEMVDLKIIHHSEAVDFNRDSYDMTYMHSEYYRMTLALNNQ